MEGKFKVWRKKRKIGESQNIQDMGKLNKKKFGAR